MKFSRNIWSPSGTSIEESNIPQQHTWLSKSQYLHIIVSVTMTANLLSEIVYMSPSYISNYANRIQKDRRYSICVKCWFKRPLLIPRATQNTDYSRGQHCVNSSNFSHMYDADTYFNLLNLMHCIISALIKKVEFGTGDLWSSTGSKPCK